MAASNKKVTVKVVKDLDDVLWVNLIRSSAFLVTEPYLEEFDGNDYMFTLNLLAYVDDNPAGTARIRLISGVDDGLVEWERFCVLQTVDPKLSPLVIMKLAKACVEHTKRMKIKNARGYAHLPKFIRMWEKMGFTKNLESPPIVYGGREYYEMNGVFHY